MVNPVSENKPTTQTESSYNSLTLLTLAVGTTALATGIYGAYRGGLALKFLNHRNSCIGLAATGLTANVAALTLGFAKSKENHPDSTNVVPDLEVQNAQNTENVAEAHTTVHIEQLDVKIAGDAFKDISLADNNSLFHIKVSDRPESLVLRKCDILFVTYKAEFNRVDEHRTQVMLGGLHLFDYRGWEMTQLEDPSDLTALIADPSAKDMQKLATISDNGVRFTSADLAKEWQQPGSYAFIGTDHISLKTSNNEYLCLPYTKQPQQGAIWEEDSIQYYSPRNGETVEIHFSPDAIGEIFALANQ